MYEAITKLLLGDFEASLCENSPELPSDLKTQLEQLMLNLCQEEIEHVLESELVQQWKNCFQEHVTDIRRNGSDLAKFWITYLQLCELLLDLIYATRTGNLELHLSCVEAVIPWTFAYDRQNYARYLIPYLNDMSALPTIMPEVFDAFVAGHFSVQMSKDNLFCQNEANKTIENTINRNCKTGGGYIGFSANFVATQRWVLNNCRRSSYRRLLREHLSLVSTENKFHKELTPFRIKSDMEAVASVVDILENVFCSQWNTEADVYQLGYQLLRRSNMIYWRLTIKERVHLGNS